MEQGFYISVGHSFRVHFSLCPLVQPPWPPAWACWPCTPWRCAPWTWRTTPSWRRPSGCQCWCGGLCPRPSSKKCTSCHSSGGPTKAMRGASCWPPSTWPSSPGTTPAWSWPCAWGSSFAATSSYPGVGGLQPRHDNFFCHPLVLLCPDPDLWSESLHRGVAQICQLLPWGLQFRGLLTEFDLQYCKWKLRVSRKIAFLYTTPQFQLFYYIKIQPKFTARFAPAHCTVRNALRNLWGKSFEKNSLRKLFWVWRFWEIQFWAWRAMLKQVLRNGLLLYFEVLHGCEWIHFGPMIFS